MDSLYTIHRVSHNRKLFTIPKVVSLLKKKKQEWIIVSEYLNYFEYFHSPIVTLFILVAGCSQLL